MRFRNGLNRSQPDSVDMAQNEDSFVLGVFGFGFYIGEIYLTLSK